MIRPRRYFPWRIARRLYLHQILFFAAACLLGALIVRYQAYHALLADSSKMAAGSPASVLASSAINSALAEIDSTIIVTFSALFFTALIYFALTTRWYAMPLGRLIQRARELRRQDAVIAEDAADGHKFEAEPAEWADLERALNRVHKDLRLKSSAQAREREELSTLIGAVSDAILAVDRGGEPLFYNSHFSALFTVARVQDRKLHLSEMFRLPAVLEAFDRVLKTGRLSDVAATMHTLNHASPRHFSISIAPLRSRDDQRVYGAVAVFHDVTELKQSEQIRIEFVGNASHELRTPLTSIKGYVDTLKEDLKTGRFDGASDFLNIISRNVDRLIFLVNDLLDLSVIESGAEVSKARVSTREITDGALRQLEPKRASKNQELYVHFDTDWVLCEPRRVEQVLVNLVHNAIKYIPENKRIDVYWEKTGDQTLLRVKDNGPGVSTDHQPRLFERFYRVDTGRSRDQGGTGLGLAIVKHIMLKHGGGVRLISASGQGAEFICTFPT